MVDRSSLWSARVVSRQLYTTFRPIGLLQVYNIEQAVRVSLMLADSMEQRHFLSGTAVFALVFLTAALSVTPGTYMYVYVTARIVSATE